MHKCFSDTLTEPLKGILTELERSVSRTLTGLGVFPSCKGHLLLIDSILYYIVQYPTGAARRLYSTVSGWHNCTPKALESGIRHALKAAHNSGMLLRLNGLVGAAVLDPGYVPANLQFISLVAQYCYFRYGGELPDGTGA
jgi:hypothetical protein